MIQLCQFRAQRSDRAPVEFYLGPVCNQDVDEAADPVRRVFSVGLPLFEHSLGVRESQVDDCVQDLIFGLKMMIEVATGDSYRARNIGERRVPVALLIKQAISDVYDV